MKIRVSHGSLEARMREPDGEPRGAAVVCHPHPLYGGTMHTKAVFRTAQALNEVGIRALRFNFRGVGASTGEHDGGVGEQEDVRAALDRLQEDSPELPLLLAGFSFGSRVGLEVGIDEGRVRALIGLGLPASLYDFSFLKRTRKPTLVVQGEHDEFGPAARVHDEIGPLSEWISVVTVDGAGHYFHDHFEPMKAAIRDFLTEGPGASVVPGGEDAGSD